VPVIDPELIKNLLKVLSTQFQQMSSKLSVDSSKIQQYFKNISEIVQFLELRKSKVKDYDVYSEALEEARIVGAYMGLINFTHQLDCLNPKIRFALTEYLKNLTQEFNFENKTEQVLNEIPDCLSEETVKTIALKPNFFAWLTQPFKFNLAQVSNPPQNSEAPSMVITPAFQETENAIELTNLKSSAEDMIKSSAQRKEEERKEQIGDIWPVEKCVQVIVDQDINGGKVLCKKYETLIPGKNIEKFKEEVSLNNPLGNPAQDINTFLILFASNPKLTQIGITTPPYSLPQEFGGIFRSKDEIITIIDRLCSSYKLGDVNEPTLAYYLCLKQVVDQLGRLVKILRQEAFDQLNYAFKVKGDLEGTKNYAERVLASINPDVCPKASQDLENMIGILNDKIVNYDQAINKINATLVQLDSLLLTINNLINQIDAIINQIMQVDSIINQIMQRGGAPLDGIFYQLINTIADAILQSNDLSQRLYKSEFSNSAILNDFYERNVMFTKIRSYEMAVENNQCTSTSSGAIAFIKNPVIVVESKKEQNKLFNILALFKNMFSPKLVEIRNEK
jgi:hypothetical protein